MSGGRTIAALVVLAAPCSVAATPGCGCPVNSCCGEDLLAGAFAGILTARNGTPAASASGSVFGGGRPWSPACSLLNLIPGIEGEGGLCDPNATTPGNSSLDVCGAIAADAAAVELSGAEAPPRVGLFVEPGACGQLDSGTCWSTPSNESWYAEWAHFRSPALPGSQSCSSTSVHRTGDASPAMLVGLQCPANSSHPDGLRVVMKWVEAASSERACDVEGDLDEVLGADAWTEGDRPRAPRWACFDVPRGSLGQASYRAVLYSVGELPCVAEAHTTTDGRSGTIDSAVSCGVATPLLLSSVAAMVFQTSM